jgi:hypothetical protein
VLIVRVSSSVLVPKLVETVRMTWIVALEPVGVAMLDSLAA